jgi:hypothetical protein
LLSSHFQGRQENETKLVKFLDTSVDAIRADVKEDLKDTEEMSRKQAAMLAAEIPKISVLTRKPIRLLSCALFPFRSLFAWKFSFSGWMFKFASKSVELKECIVMLHLHTHAK